MLTFVRLSVPFAALTVPFAALIVTDPVYDTPADAAAAFLPPDFPPDFPPADCDISSEPSIDVSSPPVLTFPLPLTDTSLKIFDAPAISPSNPGFSPFVMASCVVNPSSSPGILSFATPIFTFGV